MNIKSKKMAKQSHFEIVFDGLATRIFVADTVSLHRSVKKNITIFAVVEIEQHEDMKSSFNFFALQNTSLKLNIWAKP